ncbi:MAG: hypothetical protein CBE11_00395 [Rickettsiales bacterium TMED251]|nr:MAG: hypothetical protein CBE11_00395 [Rickettsiales bacterium TMED251]
MAYHLQIKCMKLFQLIFSIFFLLEFVNANNFSCLQATQKFEKIYELPNKLLLSMALTESGRKLKNGDFVSWPWTVNYKGTGKFFKNKKIAVDFVNNYTQGGRKNIDLGCMQINYMYHPNAFKNFSDAFDPQMNVEWSAKLIKTLYDRFGSWKKAVGYYHSYRTSKRTKYSAKVFDTWLDIKNNNKYNDIEYINNKENPRNEFTKLSFPIKKEKERNITKDDNKENNDENKNELSGSPYIMARMEKVRFFREYFSRIK